MSLLQPVFQLPPALLPQLIPVLLELPSDKVSHQLSAIVKEAPQDIAKLATFINNVSNRAST